MAQPASSDELLLCVSSSCGSGRGNGPDPALDQSQHIVRGMAGGFCRDGGGAAPACSRRALGLAGLAALVAGASPSVHDGLRVCRCNPPAQSPTVYQPPVAVSPSACTPPHLIQPAWSACPLPGVQPSAEVLASPQVERPARLVLPQPRAQASRGGATDERSREGEGHDVKRLRQSGWSQPRVSFTAIS